MNDEVLARRLAALTGLTLAATMALWWLGSSRIALDRVSDAGRASADALQALWLVRGMALALVSVRVAALRGWHPGMAVGLMLIAPAWPVLVLVWSASTLPWLTAAVVELLLVAASFVLPLFGQALRRAVPRAESAEVIATSIGLALASAVWVTRALWAGLLR